MSLKSIQGQGLFYLDALKLTHGNVSSFVVRANKLMPCVSYIARSKRIHIPFEI